MVSEAGRSRLLRRIVMANAACLFALARRRNLNSASASVGKHTPPISARPERSAGSLPA